MSHVSGVVLVSPYTSIREIVQEHVGSVISWLTAGSSDWNSMHMMKEVFFFRFHFFIFKGALTGIVCI